MAQSLLVLVVLFCRAFLVLAICDLQTRIEDPILVLLNECFVQISDDVI